MQRVNVLKIHVPSVPQRLLDGELKAIILAGIERNPTTQLCPFVEEADYIFVDFRHLSDLAYKTPYPDKTVIIDYRDNPYAVFDQDALLYFKRSVVDKRRNCFAAYPRDVIPIGYCIKDDYLNRESEFSATRDIDIAVFFDQHEDPTTARNKYRSGVTQYIKSQFAHHNIFTGIAGSCGDPGRSGFQGEYFDIMARAKIVVTCNPDRWEGDYRLYEALSSGSLVLSDKMLTPLENPFVDWQYLIYYDKQNLDGMGDIIEALLANDGARECIANAGYEHAVKWHTATQRMGEIVKVLHVIEALGERNAGLATSTVVGS